MVMNNHIEALWTFARPHTIIGTSLAVLTLYLIALRSVGSDWDWGVLLVTYLASILVNIYVVGLNQLTDIDIDRINKPYLPLAAEIFTWNFGVLIVAVTGIGAFLVAALGGTYLLGTVSIVFLLGTVYSLPPLRLKRFPFWAAACITLARAVVGNVGIYLFYTNALAGNPHVPFPILLFTGFMFGMSIVIALMKDVPDIKGDEQYHIATLGVRLGARRVMWICWTILSLCYGSMILAGFIGVPSLNNVIIVLGHAVAFAVMGLRGRTLDLADGQAVYDYYMIIWKLFYAEFLIFLVAAILM